MALKKWQIRFEKARQLAKEGREKLFERVKELVAAYEDKEFQSDMKKERKSEIDILRMFNDEVSDTLADFPTLQELLKMFPHKEQWAGGDPRVMKAQCLDSLAKANKNGKAENAERNGHSLNGKKERPSEEITSVHKSWKAEALALRQEVKMLRKELKIVKQDNKDLKALLKKELQTV